VSLFLWVIKYTAGGLVAFATPRLLVAIGVPLDRWIIAVGRSISLRFNREVALWLAALIVGAVLYGGTVALPYLLVEHGASQPAGLAALTTEQLRTAITEYAKSIRTFEINYKTQDEIQTLSRPPFPPDWQTNPEAKAAYSKALDENFQRNNAMSAQLRGKMQSAFNNEYATRGRELESELLTRLARVGKFDYGKEYERMALTGFFNGPHPILDLADYLERNVRRLEP